MSSLGLPQRDAPPPAAEPSIIPAPAMPPTMNLPNTSSPATAAAAARLLSHTRSPTAPLRLLSLDGGGVRGLSSLMVLDALMKSIAAEEKRLGIRAGTDRRPCKPCDYFDLIGGTSTGGIIAVLLGRLRLDVPTCIDIYVALSAEIFARDRSVSVFGVKLPTSTTRFSGAVLERAIKRALCTLGFDEDELMWDEGLFEEVDGWAEEAAGAQENIWVDAVGAGSALAAGAAAGVEAMTLTESPTATTAKGSEEALVNESAKTAGFEEDMGTSMPGVFEGSPGDALAERQRHVRGSSTWKMHKRASVHKKADRKGCRAFVVSALKNALGLPRILATYDPNDRQTRIWEALRATSAAPRFFEEMQFGTPKVTYLDGAVGFNNPCAEVDYAAKSIWPGRAIGVIVSVGTGLQTIPSVKKMASWLPFGLGRDLALASALANMATGTARVDNEMQRMYYGSPTRYFRFDVDGGLAEVPLEQWMREDEMAALTEQYMRDPAQIWRSRQLSELMVRLSAPPPRFEIHAQSFRIGLTGRDVIDGAFRMEELDFKTGFPLGVRVSLEDVAKLQEYRSSSPSGKGGLTIDETGRMRKIYPVALDLDGDGRKEETVVVTCVRADKTCLRALRTGIPSGRYRVKFIVCFFNTEHAIPSEIIFSVGRPFDAATFASRNVDPKITPDIVPVLLHPDAVRVRVGKTRYHAQKAQGWLEIEGDVEVQVGLEGILGFVISSIYKEDVFVGGWSFGGVRLDPVFEAVR